MTESIQADRSNRWAPWTVAPEAGFEVADPEGKVALVQVSKTEFKVLTAFRFTGEKTREDLRVQLTKEGRSPEEAAFMIDDACRFDVPNEHTDLASIPPFMRWFENTYGCHTLAAVIHDRLIRSEGPNTGALRSDTLADRFFRHMLEATGVRSFKAMILWTAVALRSRWAVGGSPRVKLVLWMVLAGLGILLLANGVYPRWSLLGVGAGWWVGLALVVPWPLAPLLWGKQYGAGLVAAVALPWVVPVAALVLAGSLVYRLSEAVVGITPLSGRWRETPGCRPIPPSTAGRDTGPLRTDRAPGGEGPPARTLPAGAGGYEPG